MPRSARERAEGSTFTGMPSVCQPDSRQPIPPDEMVQAATGVSGPLLRDITDFILRRDERLRSPRRARGGGEVLIAPVDLSLRWQVVCGDALAVLSTLPDACVQTCVTSPPYWGLRDYGVAGQLGLESTPAEYVARMVAVFREVRRVLRDDGTLWLNLGDSYAGSWGAQSRPNRNDVGPTLGGGSMLSARQIAAHPKETSTGSLKNTPGLKGKDLVGIPWRVAFALQADGWWLRSDIVWAKPNPMPESVTDRPTKAHEYLFLLSKSAEYHYDADAIAEASVGLNAHDLTGPGWCAPGQTKQTGSRRLAMAAIRASGGLLTGGVERSSLGVPADGTRNRRTVWTVATEPYAGAHFAVMPTRLVEPCIRAGSPRDGLVLDPFTGSGTVGVVALREGCRFIGAELNPEYVALANERIGREARQGTLPLSPTSAAER